MIVPAILFLFLIALIACLNINKTLDDRKTINRFHQIYYNSNIWKTTKWLGVCSRQNIFDNWIVQEIICEEKPDFIIETGCFNCGTTLFYATVLEKVNKNGKIIAIDIKPDTGKAEELQLFKERVEVIKGDSVSPKIIDMVSKKVTGRRTLVILDSLHTKKHVLKELNSYAGFVSLNSYIIVQDTNINGHPVLPNFGPGPMEAVREFLIHNKNFKPDRSREKMLITFYPSGYLKRIR